MTAAAPRCAIVIPTYEGSLLTRTCLKALLANPPSSCEAQIVVVDDASRDGTGEMLAQLDEPLTVVTHEQSQGFATSCNDGARAAVDCKYIVFLNNDTIPTAGWLDALVAHALATPEAGAVGAKLLFPNGTIQHAGVTIAQDGWPRHLYAGFPGEHRAVNRSRVVAAATAACLLVRREDFEQLGGFDTAYRNGYEDVDLCLKLRRRGREVWYCHKSVVYHLESVTRWPSGVPAGVEENTALYAKRWLQATEPDDVRHYLEDGLLDVEYGPYYPITLSVAPELAAVRRDAEDLTGLERLLAQRSRQVMDLLSSHTRAALQRSIAADLAAAAPAPSTGIAASILARGRIHELGSNELGSTGNETLVSLLLPLKNQQRDVRELFPLILAQKAPARLEIIAVDSGSSDETVLALEEFGATVVAIDPADFDHGLTRNLAAQHARGDVLLFLSGRSRPADDNWLAPLLSVLEEDPAAAGVCSRVLPQADADLLTVRDGERELSASARRERKAIDDWELYRSLSVEQRRVYLNFHTVGAAVRADALRQVPFRSVETLGEDLLWAREALEAGWSLWHEPLSAVRHSHDYTLRELFARNVDDGLANREINDRVLEEEELLPMLRAMVGDDWSYLRGTLGLEGAELERWQLDSAMRRVAQVVGQWVGINHRELPEGLVTFFSGVHRARRTR
jgi:GT2 family glycosyltransferase